MFELVSTNELILVLLYGVVVSLAAHWVTRLQEKPVTKKERVRENLPVYVPNHSFASEIAMRVEHSLRMCLSAFARGKVNRGGWTQEARECLTLHRDECRRYVQFFESPELTQHSNILTRALQADPSARALVEHYFTSNPKEGVYLKEIDLKNQNTPP